MTDKESSNTEDAGTSNNTLSDSLVNILECSTCKKQYSTAAAREKHKCPWCKNCQRLYSTYQKYQQHRTKCLQKSKVKVFVNEELDVDQLYKSLFTRDNPHGALLKDTPKKSRVRKPKKEPKSKNFENTATMLKALGTDIKPVGSEIEGAIGQGAFSLPFPQQQQDLAQVLAWRQLLAVVCKLFVGF